MPTIIVLGTGTGVGKTYVTSELARLLAGRFPNDQVIALKPIESGATSIADTDAAILGKISRPASEPRHAFALHDPISPHLAALRESKEIALANITQWVAARQNELKAGKSAQHKYRCWTLIETAGGAFTPLSPTLTNVSMANAFEPAIWVLVAPDRLGVLHDLTATLLALEKVARLPDLLLLNAPPIPDASTGTNRHEIESLGIARVAGEIAHDANLQSRDIEQLFERLRAADTST